MWKYNGMCITEAQETAKQRLTLPAARLMSHTAEAEAKGINTLMPKERSNVCSQLQSSNISRADLPRVGEIQYWMETEPCTRH